MIMDEDMTMGWVEWRMNVKTSYVYAHVRLPNAYLLRTYYSFSFVMNEWRQIARGEREAWQWLFHLGNWGFWLNAKSASCRSTLVGDYPMCHRGQPKDSSSSHLTSLPDYKSTRRESEWDSDTDYEISQTSHHIAWHSTTWSSCSMRQPE